jgi:hypothetical protein
MCPTPNSGYVTGRLVSRSRKLIGCITPAPLPEPPRADSAVTLIRFGRHRPGMWNGGD